MIKSILHKLYCIFICTYSVDRGMTFSHSCKVKYGEEYCKFYRPIRMSSEEQKEYDKKFLIPAVSYEPIGVSVDFARLTKQDILEIQEIIKNEAELRYIKNKKEK